MEREGEMMELAPDGVGVDGGVDVDDGVAGVYGGVGEGIIHEGFVKVSVGVDERGSAAFSFILPVEEFGGFAAVLWSGATFTGSIRAMRQEPTPSPPSGIGSYTPYRTDGSSIRPSPASASRPVLVV